MPWLDTLIQSMGLDRETDFTGLMVPGLLVLALALLVLLVCRWLLLRVVGGVVAKTRTGWDDVLLRNRLFHRIALLAPLLVVYSFAPALFPPTSGAATAAQRGAFVFIILIAILAVDAFLSSVVDIYRSFEVSRTKPIKSYVQVIKIVLWVLASILMISAVLGKSPWALLGGLGALSAVMMLVFKDTILGFVASIQLASYDMVRIGDWIEVGDQGIDGDVLDLTLQTVKIRNFDMTTSTIPTYWLVSKGFKNWRGMFESEGRRIKRSVALDVNSVRFLDDELLERVGRIQLLEGYLASKGEELTDWNAGQKVSDTSMVNGRRLTNIGTLRAYVEAYLRQHPMIHQEMTLLVRQLPPSDKGVPIELYVFCTEQRWVPYEAIQSDIMDHIFAIVGEFDLRVYQSPTGADLRSLSRATLGPSEPVE